MLVVDPNKLCNVRFSQVYLKDSKGRPVMGADGTPRIEIMVSLYHPGSESRQVAVKNIKELKPDPYGDPDSEGYAIAKALWDKIEPQYRAWVTGQEAPQTGTPLAAWPGLPAELADVLRTFGLRTVEEFGAASDGVITRVPIPNVRTWQQDARMFLDARADQGMASKMDALLEANRIKDEQLEELKAIVLEMQAKSKGKRKAPVETDEVEEAA